MPRTVSKKQLLRISAWRAEMHRGSGFFLSSPFPNVGNQRLHWAVKARQTKKHRGMGCQAGKDLMIRIVKAPRYMVTLTRYSSKLGDSDALPSAFKALRDGIADAFGVDDSPGSPLSWEYKQELCPLGCCGCRIEIQTNWLDEREPS